jgi:hypothetical protein
MGNTPEELTLKLMKGGELNENVKSYNRRNKSCS